MGRVEQLVAVCADPEGVATALARMGPRAAVLDADERLGAAAVVVMAASDSLRELIVSDEAALAVLAHGARPVALDDSSIQGLVRTRRLAFLRIVAQELLGQVTLDETTAQLSGLASQVLASAVAMAGATGLGVVAMGKLGAEELNFVSDVDVMFVGEGDPVELERSAREVVRIAGQCVAVDTTLRPEGRDGPLVRSVESYVAYWRRWARPWEFQALLKSRPVAGAPALRQAFSAAASEALWNYDFDREALDEIRRLKHRAEADAVRRGVIDRDVKRGRGGIRDIEFSVQLLQLVHGGGDPLLRVRGTRAALAELRAGGYVDGEEAQTVDDAYVFLRRVEHAVQLVAERQTHEVPEHRDQRRRIARVLGRRGTPAIGPTEALDEELAMRRLAVRRVHEGWYFRPLLDAFSGAGGREVDPASAQRLRSFGFTDAERTRQAVVELTRGLTRSSRLMRQLLPLLFDWLSLTPDPDLGLLGLRRLATGERRALALASAFRDSATVARNLATVLGSAPVVTSILEANPDLVERLDDPERLRTLDHDALVRSATSAVDWRPTLDEQQAALGRWMRRHRFGIIARDLLGQSTAITVGTDLSAVADAVVETAVRLLRPAIPFAAIGLGRLGGRELSYGSDIDVVFVYDGAGSADFAEAERVATGVLRIVGGLTPATQIFDIDPDLRPEGKQGPLARSLDSYNIYLDRWGEVWERQALLRARPVAGSDSAGTGFAALLDRHVWNRTPSDAEIREMRRVKARIERERIPAGADPRMHTKLGPGSLTDVEFTVQLQQWKAGIRHASTTQALAALGRRQVIDATDQEVLADALRICDALRNRRWLVCGPGDTVPASTAEITKLVRSLGTTRGELTDEYLRVTRRCRAVVKRLFYGESGAA